MSRKGIKRSISSLLDDEETTSTSRLVRCDCTKCNGKMVDHRTKEIHEARDPDSHLTVSTTFSESESRNQGS